MRKKSGYSILEVLIASVVFLLAAMPIYYAVAGNAGKGIETTKLSMARKILESFREEIMSRKFDELEGLAGGSTTFIALGGGFPKTMSDVLDFQKQYKDFEFNPEVRVSPDRNTVLEFKGSITWTTNTGDKVKPEKLAFVVVKP